MWNLNCGTATVRCCWGVDAVSLQSGRAVLRLAGELGLSNCARLRQTLNAGLGAGRAWLVLGRAGLALTNSTGWPVLAGGQRKS